MEYRKLNNFVVAPSGVRAEECIVDGTADRNELPPLATAVTAIAILTFALTLSLERLAQFASYIALAVFTAVDVAPSQLRRQVPSVDTFSVLPSVPVTGVVLCGGRLLLQSLTATIVCFEAVP